MTQVQGKAFEKKAAPLVEEFLRRGGVSPVVSDEYVVLPGFCDVHVHLREPGFSYKETVKKGSMAGAHGGYTVLCAMPNLYPVPDNREHLEKELAIIKRDAVIRVYPYGAISVGEMGQTLADLSGMAATVCGFSDDGKGVMDENLMRQAMREAKSLGKILAAHCEDARLIGGCIHDGPYAKAGGYRGIPSASEYLQVERDLRLAEETGVKYHICHVSCKESVELIRQAKKKGVDVTCETAPHYLLLTEKDLREEGRFKMNPPIREEEDRQALIEGILDGTVDMIATDHAPHSEEEKSRGLTGSPFGIVGLETAFPVLYTGLVKKGILTLKKLVELLSDNPRRRFGLTLEKEEYTVFETQTPYEICKKDFLSKGKSSPFEGWTVLGKCKKTVCGGKTVWQETVQEN